MEQWETVTIQAGFNEDVTFKQRLKGGEGVSPVESWGTSVKEERIASLKSLRQRQTGMFKNQ